MGDTKAPENADDQGRATGPNADEADTKDKLDAEAKGQVIDPDSGGNTDEPEDDGDVPEDD